MWSLGYPDQARQKSEAARTLGQEVSHPFSVAVARVFATMLYQLRRERALTQEWAEAAIILAREHGFPQWLGLGTILQGWAFADQGQSEEGISQMRQGLATRQALARGISILLSCPAGRGLWESGAGREGLAALAEALTVVDKSGERFYEAELYRLIAVFR